MHHPFQIVSEYQPQGDQPKAIASLCEGLAQGVRDQVLLGVTGSGKTYTMAKVIEQTQRPAMVLAHNKTLAAQLYSEFKRFLPHNAVEYFVSYYDYYQPEAYVAKTDTFIEKDSAINEQIDRLRHSATRSLLERQDVVVVASVSCIYGIGSAETYSQMTIELNAGQSLDPQSMIRQLAELQYERNDIGFVRGSFRVRGDNIDLFPAHLEDRAWRFSFFGDELESISEFDPLTGEPCGKMQTVTIYANSHYVTPRPTIDQAIRAIKEELKERLEWLHAHNKLLEAQRLEQRTSYDLEMLVETGMCKGIENYSRYLSGTKAGDPPPTLFQYLPRNALLFVDESHVMLPQLRAMYNGDKSRKSVLAEYGFRLPSCMDNRPLKFEEWDAMRPDTIYVSATPSEMELQLCEGHVIEQVIRPTGLIDPPTIIRPVATQVDDLIAECQAVVAQGMRIMVTTLTKKMAEQLTEYLNDVNVKTRYLHSDIDTLERVEILRDLRLGQYDVLVGVNLLREGLDIPECGLMAILDADKEGFLRSKTSLIQTIGRAARNERARVILYADKITESMRAAIEETDRRRAIQVAHNAKYGIVPHTIIKAIGDDLRRDDAIGEAAAQAEAESRKGGKLKASALKGEKLEQHLVRLRQQMLEAAANLEFELAAKLRDDIEKYKKADKQV